MLYHQANQIAFDADLLMLVSINDGGAKTFVSRNNSRLRPISPAGNDSFKNFPPFVHLFFFLLIGY